MDVISMTAKEKKKKIAELLELEENLIEARLLKRVKARTGREKQELLNLPKYLVWLETQIHNAAAELGSEEFRELTGVTDDRAKHLLALQVAKGKLYEAKVGVIEARRRSERTGGTTSQGRLNYIKSHKSKLFKTKYNSYHRRVSGYNDRFQPEPLLDDPSLAEVERMEISDLFWAGGSTLSHPEEPWANDLPTREGIQAFLSCRSAEEEMCCISREARQLSQWALEYQSKVDLVDPGAVDGTDVSGVIQKSLYAGLASETRRLWYNWNFDLIDVIRSTAVHLPSPLRLAHDQEIVGQWKDLMEIKFGHWEHTLVRIAVPDLSDIYSQMEAEVEEEELLAPEDFDMGEDDDALTCIYLIYTH
ncbi:uncharacterized protein MELLADRAFT_112127 [Melampsora larici-populina 98AG31]|uniref:Uncharacterized protein n=1 Tax=Melampsora larici-populina (strain 98AG31 / pathotype 3-4-7) TaxID=747676 RepID=F4S5H1_MELLP|nr:uncharacterized protein MELLADRAFT_112127 [Melampsora larici-populina 98AG31]EGG00025.1 hypothetical protein MELLADRAFT_112127 [Melampsora larici-populina 98AG31]